MKQIKDINCIYISNDNISKERYVGDLIIYNNEFIEGILINTETRRSYLAFGYARNGELVNIVKGVCDRENEYPTELRLRKKGNEYRGDVSIRSTFADFPIGRSETKLFDLRNSNQSKNIIIEKLEKRIEELKLNMNKETSRIYNITMPKKNKEKKFSISFKRI